MAGELELEKTQDFDSMSIPASCLHTGLTPLSGGTLPADPLTDEMFEEAAKTLSTESARSHQPVPSRRPQTRSKPTVLTFQRLQDDPNVVKCQLVLCNISERVLHFRLKSSTVSSIVSVPFGNGHIAPHSQIRLVLTWTKSEKSKKWANIAQPKLILTTRFLDVRQADIELTHTRLVAKVGKNQCSASNPPVEQLLLDAAKAHQEEKLDETSNKEQNMGQVLADFVNNLSDRGIVALIIILAVVVLIFFGGRR